MPERTGSQAVSVVLHDVAPQTWPDYQDFIQAVDALGPVPLTLLVVPDFHRHGHVDRFPGFRADIERRIARGDEVVLHGYCHCDDAPLPVNPLELFMRRVYTHEGEFYRLSEAQALERLERGLALFSSYQWPLRGFVAPAWLMSRGTRAALRRLTLRYTSVPAGLIRLPEWRLLDAPTLVWSSRSAWRRWVSRQWNRRRLHRSLDRPLIRLGLHPVDMRHGGAVRFWLDTLETLLACRTPLTKSQWLDMAP